MSYYALDSFTRVHKEDNLLVVKFILFKGMTPHACSKTIHTPYWWLAANSQA
jgi:hypothetical protein